jgi:uncharacterized protein YndB with AHSA1/START domain
MENTKQEVTVTRTFDAPRELMWSVWTTPKHFANWFGIPPMTAREASTSMDVRVGGRWDGNMISDDGQTVYPFGGYYLEVAPPERLVLTMVNPQDANDPNVETLEIDFKEVDGQTEVTMRQFGHLPAEQYGEPLQNGYKQFFDRMEKYLETIK